MYADVFWDLKIYVFEALARAYKLQFFLSVHLGGLPPPPQYQKAGYATAHPYRSDYFFFSFVCLSACSAGKWGPFLGEDFWRGGGGGGGLVSSKF